ncbi:MAG: ABC transporter ATP-binding protein [Bdellovibrionota bacterium]
MSEETQFYAEDLVKFGSADSRLLLRLLRYLRPYWKMAVLAAVLLLANTALMIAIPVVLQRFVDQVLVPRDAGRLWDFTVLVLSLVTAQAVSSAFQSYLFAWLGQRVMYDIRRDLFSRVIHLPVSYFDKNPVGRLVTRVTNDIGSLNELFAGGFIQLINDVFLIAFILLTMLFLEWRLGLLILGLFAVLAGIIWYYSGKIRGVLRESKRLIARINAFLNENITGMKIIQLFGREGERDKMFREVVGRYTDTQYGLLSLQSYFLPVSTFFAGCVGALIFWYGGGQVLAGFTTIGTLAAFQTYSQMLYFPVRTFTDKYNVLLLAFASAERIFTLMDETPEPEPKTGETVPLAPGKRGEIVFDRVAFGYRSDIQALREISFRIAPGERVAVVGATGAGKTTLVSLLTRFYDYQGGSIRLDGRDIREIPRGEIRSRVGVVQQDVFLFSGTLLENLFLPGEWSPDERRRKAEEIFEALECTEFLKKLPKGLDTELAERGGNLSAGERQLVAFARLLCFDPEVVILDEATANIDSTTERLLQRATARLTRGRTSLLIAHRLSTILGCDRILVLHHGKLAEEGTHEELLAKGGIYAKLYTLQFQQQAV